MRGGSLAERRALDILEEAVNLLWSVTLQAAVVYLTGAVPFLLGLLFFLSDMARSPFAFERLLPASLGLAVLFVWKSVWQAIFAAHLYRQLSSRAIPGASTGARLGGANLRRLIAVQCALQPLSLLAIPVALLLTIPFATVIAYFRNVAMFAALGDLDPLVTARTQAALWTRQNWIVVGLVTLAGVLLFVNLLLTVAFLPQLGRSFLGIEGDLVRLGGRILNGATISVATALTWLAIDPLLDAVYALRCFYGKSIATGDDLRVAFRRAAGTAAPVVIFALVFIFMMAAPHAAMAQTEPPRAQTIDPAALDRSIDQTIHRVEFTWRAPRPREEPRGRWVGWYRNLSKSIGDFINWIAGLLRRWLESRPVAESPQDTPAARRMLQWLTGIAVALVAVAAFLVLRSRRRPAVSAIAVTAALPSINLADESVTADQLPESSWLKLAEELLARGDCRLALRALYLAGLNYLNTRGMVSLRRWKSGLDYRCELERRSRAHPGLALVFTNNVALFERGWYGRHPVDREMVDDFAAGLNEMKIAFEPQRESHAERA
jgi:hypothetical protein